MTFEAHPYADVFPMLPQAELKELADSINKNGQQLPIIIDDDGMVLDGRNRLKACKMANVEPMTERFTGTDEEKLAKVISLNLNRRQLTGTQKAFAADALANIEHGHNQHRKKVEFPAGNSTTVEAVSLEKAMEITGASNSSLGRVRTAKKHGVPELVEKMKTGEVPAWTAEVVSRLDKDEQREVVAGGKEAMLEKAKEIRDACKEAKKEEPFRARKKVGKKKKNRHLESSKTGPDTKKEARAYKEDLWECLDDFHKLHKESDKMFHNANSYNFAVERYRQHYRKLQIIADRIETILNREKS